MNEQAHNHCRVVNDFYEVEVATKHVASTMFNLANVDTILPCTNKHLARNHILYIHLHMPQLHSVPT